jgi:hypothetical protein
MLLDRIEMNVMDVLVVVLDVSDSVVCKSATPNLQV